jgi:hypothetical protein
MKLKANKLRKHNLCKSEQTNEFQYKLAWRHIR